MGTLYGNMLAQKSTNSVFKAATASAAGGTGLVPAPAAGAQNKFLRGDGTWQTIETGPSIPTTTVDGLLLYSQANGIPYWGSKPYVPVRTSGIRNVIADRTSLTNNLGGDNIIYGNNILKNSPTNCEGTTAVGAACLQSTKVSYHDTAIGYCAMMNANYVGNNVAIGAFALRNTKGTDATRASYNIAIGQSAGYMSSGSYSIFIGDYAGGNSSNAYNNAINIGKEAACSSSNQITLGNTEITSIRCQVTSFTKLSDSRVKEDIEPANIEMCLADVLRLPVSRYKYKAFTGTHLDTHVTGWMADDYEKVFPKGVQAFDETFPLLDENGDKIYETVTNPDGVEEQIAKTFVMKDVKSITPSEALPTLWGAVQALAKQVQDLTTENTELKQKISKVDDIEARLALLEK